MAAKVKRKSRAKTPAAIAWLTGGVDLHEFAGRSWKELEDVWPKPLRLASEAWKILSVTVPAQMATQEFLGELTNGGHLSLSELTQLAWLQRCEEARENMAADKEMVMRGCGVRKPITLALKFSNMIQIGLIEEIGLRARLYRLTPVGKVVLRKFVDNMEQAHYDIIGWKGLQKPRTVKRIDTWLKTSCYDWGTLQFNEHKRKQAKP